MDKLRITIEGAVIGVLLAFPLGVGLFGLLVLIHFVWGTS